MARKDDRAAQRFPIRRASASEAAGARRMIEATFTDRISWVAARVLLERSLPVIEQLREMAHVDSYGDLEQSIRTFLERHPAPEPKVKPRSLGAMTFPVAAGAMASVPGIGAFRAWQEAAARLRQIGGDPAGLSLVEIEAEYERLARGD